MVSRSFGQHEIFDREANQNVGHAVGGNDENADVDGDHEALAKLAINQAVIEQQDRELDAALRVQEADLGEEECKRDADEVLRMDVPDGAYG